MSVLPVGFGSSGSSSYSIDNSLRLRASASASLSRTPGAAGNRKLLARRFRIKRGALGSLQVIASAGTASIDRFYFDSSDRLVLDVLGTARLVTTPVYRDPSAWFVDVGFELDVANGTAGSRAKILINGTEVASYSTDGRASITNTDTNWNNTVIQYLGRDNAGNYFDGYFAEPIGVDGSVSVTAYSEQNADSVWVPKAPSATYGTTGYNLNFADAALTAGSNAGLGKDVSGNANYWTTNNISVTAGVTYDAMVDTPTNNYATLNPLDKTTNATVTSGNLKVRVAVQGSNHFSKGTMVLPLDKIYFEGTAGDNTGGVLLAEVGLVDITTQTFAGVKSGVQCTNGDLLKIVNGTYTSLGGGGVTSGTVIGLAYDLINGLMTIYRNGTAVASNQSIPTTHTAVMAHAYRDVANDVGWEMNFGQRPFTYTPPTGFKALCTANLPAVSITNPRKHFDVVTRNGFGASGGSITSLQFQPDFFWEKQRNGVSNNYLIDSVRGVSKYLYSDGTIAEATLATYLTSFNSNGYTMGSSDFSTGSTMVDWLWKANGAGVTNTAGSITSTVSANTTAGFSIVTWTIGSIANATVGHGLGVAPKFVIVRSRGSTSWGVWHTALAGTHYLNLDSTIASTSGPTVWNSTTPTSNVFSLGTAWPTSTYVAYCFAEIAGYSKFGSYTGNGSTDGPFVFCGFRPRYVLIRRITSTGGSWFLNDGARPAYNPESQTLFAEQAAAETTGIDIVDFTANGFKVRYNGAQYNNTGDTYIFAAFAEFPSGGSNVSPAPAR